jgi:hypothetical protein
MQRDSVTIRAFVARNRLVLQNWVTRDNLRPVVVTSPHTPDECLRRLAKVTTGRKSGWYLDWRTATMPDPLFHGEVGPSGIRVALFSQVSRRGGPGAWFDALVVPVPEGGTALTGTVGLPTAEAKATLGLVLIAFWAVAAVASFVIGVVITASGHFHIQVGLAIGLPVLFMLSLLAARGYHPGPGLEPAEPPIPRLLGKINGVLDSTSAFPG